MWLVGLLFAAVIAVLVLMNLSARVSMPRNPITFLPKEEAPSSFGARLRQAIGLELTMDEANAPSGLGGVSPAEALKHAHDMGMKVTPAQETESPFWKAIQAIGERSPF